MRMYNSPIWWLLAGVLFSLTKCLSDRTVTLHDIANYNGADDAQGANHDGECCVLHPATRIPRLRWLEAAVWPWVGVDTQRRILLDDVNRCVGRRRICRGYNA